MYEVNSSRTDLSTDTVPCYLLPEESHLRLKQLRDHLQLLAVLAQPRSHSEGADFAAPIEPESLATCFLHFAEWLDAVLQTAWWAGFNSVEPSPSA